MGVWSQVRADDWTAEELSSMREEASSTDLEAISTEPVMPVGATGIPPGGVTPHELRTVEIREAFRGYQREQVDALCERAAETIEHIERQRRDLEERLRRALELRSDSVATGRRATGAREREVDVAHRTILLAQQAADESLAEATSRAEQLVREAETKAHALVSEAEATARRIAEEGRRRAAAAVEELEERRRVLEREVTVLESFADEYRTRLLRAVDAERERLDRSAVAAVAAPPKPLPIESPGPAPTRTSTPTDPRTPSDPRPPIDPPTPAAGSAAREEEPTRPDP